MSYRKTLKILFIVSLTLSFAYSPCDSICSTCSGPGANECLSCPSGRYLSSSTCQACHTDCAECSNNGASSCTSCTPPKVLYSGQCITCHTDCETCDAPGIQGCTTCTSPKVLYNGQCITCHVDCETCNAPGIQGCTTCTPPKVLYSGQCITCHADCATCDQPGNQGCTSCMPPKQYYNKQCIDCDSTCATCIKPGNQGCSTCTPPRVLYNGQCIDCHPSCDTCVLPGNQGCATCGSLTLVQGQQCIACDPSCATCNYLGNQGCTSCTQSNYYVSSNRQCIACPSSNPSCPCSIQQYFDGTSCSACHTSCLTCNGPTADKCLSCPSSTILTANYECQACDTSCLTCGISADKCTSCQPPKVLTSDYKCVACDATCKTCFGPESDDCTSCHDGYYLDSDGKCKVCPGGCAACNGPNAAQCGTPGIPCDSSCSTCTGPNANDCTGCASSHQYLDSGTCNECDTSCLTCAGPTANDCLTCNSPQVLQSGSCITITCDSSCVTCSGPSASECTSCATGQYLDSGQCQDCDPSCKTCSGAATYCTSCDSPAVLSGNTCTPCPASPSIDFTISGAKTLVYPCETLTIQVSNVISSSTHSTTWVVTSSYSNTAHENFIKSRLEGGLPIPPMTLRFGTTYQITVTVSDSCAPSKTKSVTIKTISYPTTQLTSPSTTFLSWWENDGILLGCSDCSSATLPTCSACSTPLQLVSGKCTCQNSNSYIDLTNLPSVSCISKRNSVVSLSLQKKTPKIQMQTSFSNGFSSLLPNLNYTASIMKIGFVNAGSLSVEDYSASIENATNISISFTISQDIGAGNEIQITTLAQYNQLYFSPFYIQNPSLTYELPSITYLSPAALQTVTSAGNTAGAAMQAQTAVTAVLPAITGGLSTSAMLLVGFLAEVDIYKLINVPFPDNFVMFCESMESSIFPNVFANLDTEYGGENPTSEIGQFKSWGVSTVMLDNSFTNILKLLAALGIITVSTFVVTFFKSCPDIVSLFYRLRGLVMWNVFLSFFLGDFSELLLTSMIQLRENYVSSAYTNLSLAFAVIIVTTYGLLIIYMGYRLNKTHLHLRQIVQQAHQPSDPKLKTTSQKESKKHWVEVPKSVGIIVEDFHDRNRFARNFMLVMMTVDLLMVLIVFLFQDHGLAQAIMYTVTTLMYVCLIIWQRPYKSKAQTALLLLNQTSKIGLGIVAIMLGVNEKTQSISPAAVTQMGYSLILMIVIVIGINLIIALGITVVTLYEGVKKKLMMLKASRANRQKKNQKDQTQKQTGITLEQQQTKQENGSRIIPSESKVEESLRIEVDSAGTNTIKLLDVSIMQSDQSFGTSLHIIQRKANSELQKDEAPPKRKKQKISNYLFQHTQSIDSSLDYSLPIQKPNQEIINKAKRLKVSQSNS